ncbi:GxxExxY protein [Cerasicoccus maritimus]|uniref:GxxExxY protein n=1 Tax=Cerasicoccus maritimus TaxID=490089 RepID=UPI0028527C06|nr:GxxExxY protein [Cerasicoccus maritimus]
MNTLTEKIIGAAIEVHRVLGPGLLESSYEKCLAHELHLRGIQCIRQQKQPIIYKGLEIDEGYRLDIFVEGQIILELKAVDKLTDLHLAQLLTYLKHSGCTVGYLMNFNEKLFKDGLRRVVLNHT